MKKTLIYRCLPMFAFFLILISVFIAAWCSFFYAQFVLDASDVFFGLVPPNSQVTKVVRFFNRGNKALQIKRVFVGCGCIEVSLSDRCIPPGKGGEIKITLTGKSLPGKDIAYIFIVTNDSVVPGRKIIVHYTSVSNFFLSPRQLDFGLVQSTDLPISRSFQIIEEQGEGGVLTNDLNLSLNADFLSVDKSQKASVTRALDIKLSQNAPLGFFYEVLCVSDESRREKCCASITGTVIGDIYAVPPTIDFGEICFYDSLSTPNSPSENIMISSRNSDAEVCIENVIVGDSIQQLIKCEYNAKKQSQIALTIVPQSFPSSFARRELRGNISVFCTDSANEKFVLNVPVRLIVINNT